MKQNLSRFPKPSHLTLFGWRCLNILFVIVASSLGIYAQQESQSDSLESIRSEQDRLAQEYKQLEQKLFSLYEFEKSNNPGRSKLLQRALQQSQENMTSGQLDLIVSLIKSSKLKDAEGQQKVVLSQLTELLDLLQSDDRSKVRREEIDRLKSYAKEVDRLLKIQQGIRGQAEGGVNSPRLTNSEAKLAARTDKLAKKIGKENDPNETKNEPGDESKPGNEDANTKPKDANSGENNQKPEDDNSNGKNGDPTEGSPDGNTPQEEPGNSNPQPPGDTAPSDSKGEPSSQSQDSNRSTPNDSPPSQPSGQGQPGEQSGDSESAPQDSPAQQVQSKIQAAQQRMRQAKQALDQAKRDNAVEQMKEAERALEAAKQELERILRQLREEEIEQVLALLEDRFRSMLEKELKIYQATVQLDKMEQAQRGSQFEIDAGRLGENQAKVATEAAQALLLLEEDGSSVAFPAAVEDMRQDMIQVAGRLRLAKVNSMTISLEEEILETLNFVIESLVQTQEDLQKMKNAKQEPGKSGQPGEQPLVDQLAEIKLMKALQTRIYKRHQRYAQFLENRDDPIGASDNPDIVKALQRLAERQLELTEIANELVDKIDK